MSTTSPSPGCGTARPCAAPTLTPASVRIRWYPERAPAGALCLTAADLPGPNGVQLIDDGWPILAADTVRHVGEPVALVAAPTLLAARQALAAVEVDYEPLPAVLDTGRCRARSPLSTRSGWTAATWKPPWLARPRT